eukprot:scaffold269408_cov33-Prasinocladus_malaysianus.AAC.1
MHPNLSTPPRPLADDQASLGGNGQKVTQERQLASCAPSTRRPLRTLRLMPAARRLPTSWAARSAAWGRYQGLPRTR